MFRIDSLSDLVGRARSAFRSYLPGSDAWVWPNNIAVSGKVLGGVGYEVMGFADYIQRQKFAGTADGENLDLHGQEYGLARRPATAAQGPITLTVADAVTVAAGAVFQRTDGVRYIATAAAVQTVAGTFDVPAVAATDGANTNANAGTALTIISGVTDAHGDANPLAVVGTAGIVGGADVEADGDFWTTDLATFRGRILFRKRNPPHGGSPADYVQWASDVAGVTRVYVERRWNGPGTVRLFPMFDDYYANGIPQPADVQRVQDYIDTVSPAGALVTVAAATAVPVNISVSNLLPATVTVEEAIKAELADAFRRLAAVAGNDTANPAMPFLAVPTSFSRSWIWQAIANATGEQRHVLLLPAADPALTAGQIATLGAVTFP